MCMLLLCGINSNLLANTITWSFDTPIVNGKADGWNIVNYTNGSTSGSVLNLTAQANSHIRYDEYTNPYNPNQYKYAVIRLKNTTGQTTGRFYWWGVGDNSPYYSEFNITTNDSGFKEYVIDLSANTNWTKHTSGIRIIRFDIPVGITGSSVGKTISIDKIKLSPSVPMQFAVAQPFGVNLAGAEFGAVPGIDYSYPTIAELDYFKSKGLKLFRLPFKWERIQPTLNGSLDATELAKMKSFVDAARDRELWVILDMHNYGRRTYSGDTTIIGSPSLTIAHAGDAWAKLASEFKDYDNIYAYGIMNEPNGMLPSTPWFNIAQGIINQIRAVDISTAIMVGGDDWSSASKWPVASDNLKNLVDVSDNLIYEAHVYFDKKSGGSYEETYEQEEATHNIGVVRVAPFVRWLKANNKKGFVGEYGVPNNDSRWLITLDNMLNFLKENGVNGTYWAAGPRWNSYFLSVEPQNGNDRVQMSVLQNYTVANTATGSSVIDSRAMMYNWEFNKPVATGKVEGWTIVNYANATVSGGKLQLQTVVANNHIKYGVTPLDPINPALHKYAIIKLKNTTNQTQAAFYWHDYTSYNHVTFNITANDTDYKEYVIDLSANTNWTSKSAIKIIRFDIPFGGISGSVNKTVGIDYIKLATSATPVIPLMMNGPIISNNLSKEFKVQSSESFNVAPNPVQNHINMLLNIGDRDLKVKILSSDGKIYFESFGSLEETNEKLNEKISYFQPGVYIVYIEFEGEIYQKKFIKL